MNSNNIAKTAATLRNNAHLPSIGALFVEELKTFSDKDCTDRGVWLEVFCPEDRCLREEERIELVEFCKDSGKKHDLWLEVFCPKGICEIFEGSQLP
ncbi:MAG: hypothetical protein R6W88_15635 [Desulfobacterales bacterium]